MSINIYGIMFKSLIFYGIYFIFTISFTISIILLLSLALMTLRTYLVHPEVPFIVKLISFSMRIHNILLGTYTGKFVLWRYKLVMSLYNLLGSGGPPKSIEPLNTHIEKIQVPSLIDDKHISMKIYIKNEILNSQKKQPLLIFLFPGAFMVEIPLRNKEDYLDMGFMIAHISYRLAPEYKFPTALEDVYSCLSYLNKNTHPILKYWDSRIVLYGASAGGNLAACSCLLMRDRELKMNVICQVLSAPPLFYKGELKSHVLYKNWYIHGEKDVRYIDDMLMRSEEDYENQYLCPLKHNNLKNLPNAYFNLSERDYFCSEGELYCEMLKKNGNDVVCNLYAGEHGFMAAPNELSKKAMKNLKEYLMKRLEETKM